MFRLSIPPAVALAVATACVAIAAAQDGPTKPGAAQSPPGAARTAKDKRPAKDPRAAATDGAGQTAAPANGDADAARRAQAVARFQTGEITVGDLEDTIAGYNPLMQAQYKATDKREQLLDKTLELELLAAEAKRRGFDKDPEVQHASKQHAVQLMIQKDFDEGLSFKNVSEEEARAHYDDNLKEYKRPEMRRASHVLLATKAEAMEVLKEVKKSDLRTFRRLAREKSIDTSSKLRGGDLRYFDAQGNTPGNDGEGAPLSIAKAAFSLKASGDTYNGVVPVEGGFSVLRLTGIREKNERSFAQVKENIRLRLWREKRKQAINELVQKLKDKHSPRVKADLIGLVKLDDGPPVPRSGQLPTPFPHKSAPQGSKQQPGPPAAKTAPAADRPGEK